MPCYEVNLVSVEFRAENEELLKKAVVGLGWQYEKVADAVYVNDGQIYIVNGQARSESQASINTLKRAYSQEVVKAAAKSKGWAGSWQGAVTSNKLQAQFKKF